MYLAAFRDMSSQSQSATNSVLTIMPSASSASTGHPVTTQSFSVPTNTASTSLHSITVAELPPLHPTVQLQSFQWHSGMSPHPYELVPLPAKAQKCYGCGTNFLNKYHSPPFNIVVRHMDRRVIRKNEQTGQLVHSSDYGNTYYHPHPTHIRQKNPVFTGLVFVSPALYNSVLRVLWIHMSSMLFLKTN